MEGEQLARIAERHDTKVRLLFQLLNYISLVHYDPLKAKTDKSNEFKRFVQKFDLDIWAKVAGKAETRKATKRVNIVKSEIQKLQPKLSRALSSAAPVIPTRKRSVAQAAQPPPQADSDEFESLNQLEVDDDLGWPEPSHKKRKTSPVITNPLHYIKPQHSSLSEFLNSYKTITDDNEAITQDNWDRKIAQDADAVSRVFNAKSSGRLAEIEKRGLSSEKQFTKFVDPPVDLSFYGNLLAQVVQLSKQRQNLRKYHQSIVKRNTQSVEQYFRRLAGAEDREKKELDRLLKQIARKTGQEVVKKWKLAEKVVEQRRQAILDEQKREKGKEYLNEILDKSAKLIESRNQEDQSDSSGSDSESDIDQSDHGMETSGKYKDIPDTELTIDQLREKYSNLPDLSDNEESDNESDHSVEGSAQPEQAAVQEEPKEVEEPEDKPSEEALKLYAEHNDGAAQSESEMESESGSSEGSEADSDSESESESATEDRPNLASLFGNVANDSESDAEDYESSDGEVENENGKAEVETDKDQEQTETKLINEPEPATEDTAAIEPVEPVEPAADVADEPKVEGNDTTLGNSKPFETETEQELAPIHQELVHRDPSILLKGTLREYQLNGLDWMAGLIQSGTNGILADEMGLGKTIQTIALMSWMAWEKKIWGPHLIVVPTSVMLNWEMEFKRFLPGFKILTYFGTPQQRKRKRRGWNKEDTWHVCITSYQLVIQDQAVFRGKKWQFMVLDEAHNIKNFRSQRWQALLNFNAQFRLLLTGTPLQNNLVELWSLLYFLMPSSRATQMMPEGFASLEDFQEWFAKPVDQMVEEGNEADDEAKRTISKLHQILRPYLLRRLKIDVEKQMPGKYEHVIYCKLSKRQRYLYDDFMSRASTKATLESGNFMSILNCLMQLRKVCNHPDLFEVRPIVSSFAIDYSVSQRYGQLQAKKFSIDEVSKCDSMVKELNLEFSSNENQSKLVGSEIARLSATAMIAKELPELRQLVDESKCDANFDNVESWAKYSLYKRRLQRLHNLEQTVFHNSVRTNKVPLFGTDCLKLLRVFEQPRRGVLSYLQRQQMMNPLIIRFGCITPAIICLDQPELTLGEISTNIYDYGLEKSELFHEPQVRLSIAFPDKRLLQYDCGKLQKLAILLRDLISKGHRCLIFTQMTKVLDILEQFLNLHGWRYLRLDGATRIEQRQALTERFNKDENIPVFILSTRSGGLGINLTGADTVIFYDSDWNPAMDRQCQDRCHRIGQTRDVHIYRLVSEFTIESNILRKATQKTVLDNVVIQEGDFTTEHFTKMSVQDILGDDAGRGAAGPSLEELQDNQNASRRIEAAMAATEDRDDQVAANLALNEAKMDQVEFEENKDVNDTLDPTAPPAPDSNVEILEIDEIEDLDQQGNQEIGHIDDWMIKAIENYDLF